LDRDVKQILAQVCIFIEIETDKVRERARKRKREIERENVRERGRELQVYERVPVLPVGQ